MHITVIIGATTNPERYAYLAAERLHRHGVPFVPVGIKQGSVFGQPILDLRKRPPIPEVHTLTLYLSAHNQAEWEDYMLSLRPKRIIFNPGAENPAFALRAAELGIDVEEACTLVMLASGVY